MEIIDKTPEGVGVVFTAEEFECFRFMVKMVGAGTVQRRYTATSNAAGFVAADSRFVGITRGPWYDMKCALRDQGLYPENFMEW